jgi:8-amino-7-oxononanoate synthase
MENDIVEHLAPTVAYGTEPAAAFAGGDRLDQYTSNPFDGLFENGTASGVIEPGSLLDTPAAHRLFNLMAAGISESVYTYQLPLSQAAKTESGALGNDLVMFSSYSYLGLIGHPRLARAVQEAVARYGTSTGGARLLTGTLELHLELEEELARFIGSESAAVFPSGYDANVAAISALFGPDDVAIVDHYSHNSIWAGVRMAGCEAVRFRHNDVDDLERRLREVRAAGARRILVAIDSVFSMDGDLAPLAEIIELKNRYRAFLLVDEAHSLGALGATGRGICEEEGLDPNSIDIITGSLSKAIPSSGGYLAGSVPLKVYIQHGSAPYVFSGAMSPTNAAAALEALRIMQEEPEHVRRLRENTRRLHDGLKELGLDSGNRRVPLIALMLGDEWRAYRWARRLLERGVFVSAVTYPAVSPRLARLRLCATASQRPEHFDRLFEGLAACLADEE